MNNSALTEQLVDLQTRLSFQEDTIQVMSQQMADQAEQIRVAQKHIQLLNEKINELRSNADGRNTNLQERPPHY